MKRPELSIILPCRNEEKSLALCILAIKDIFNKHKISGEIIVSDSSIDQSPFIAKELGVTLVKHDKEGYGRACLEGFKIAKGKYLFFADPDKTYDFEEINQFLKYMISGYDVVIGNRFGGKMQKGAMPLMNKYVGNPAISKIIWLFFGGGIQDSLCGMRAITKKAFNQLNLETTGMEFASEMIIKALKNNLKIKEVPINYYRRLGDSKLRPLSDGLRHLKFIFCSFIQTLRIPRSLL